MALGCIMLLALLLSTLQDCWPRPTEQGLQWVWGEAEETPAEPPLPSRRRRADTGPRSATVPPVGNETASPGHDMLMGTEPSNTTGQPKALVVTTMDPFDDSPEPDTLLGTEVDNTSSQALVLTTVSSLDGTDSPQSFLGTEPPPKPGNITRQAKALPVMTADPLDETNSPEPIQLSGTELPPKMGDSTSKAKALAVTTVDPLDETDAPETVPSTAPQSGSTIVPNQLMESIGHSTDGTVPSDMDMDISTEPHSALLPTSTLSKKSSSHPPREVSTTPLSTKPRGSTAPDPSDDLWDDSSLMNKCLLAILLLALVAGLFMVSTAVLGTLLWRRVRTARRQLGPTEMICISSLLPDSERAVTNGPRRGIPVRHKLLVDASSEADGDNLTLSSFLPEHS